MGYIYKITNKLNEKVYVGQTVNYTKRVKEHLRNKNYDYTVVYKEE